MEELLELGKVSARGQIAIPAQIRREMGLSDGSKVLFFLENNVLLVKKVDIGTWEEVTRPLRQMKVKMTNAQIDRFVHKVRRERSSQG